MIVADVRFAVRRLRTSPIFTIVAVCTLALGIGANIAVFSVVNALLFQPLAVKNPGELVNIYRRYSPRMGMRSMSVSAPDYEDIRSQKDVFSGALAYSMIREAVTIDGTAEMALGEGVSDNYFDTLGVAMSLGRPFARDEGGPAVQPVVVISDRLWSRKFARSPEALGGTLKLADVPVTIIGVAPASFRGLNYAGAILSTDLWVPLGTASKVRSRTPPIVSERDFGVLQVKARLSPGVAFETAQAAMKTLAAQLERSYPTPDEGPRTLRRTFDVRRTRSVMLHETVDQFALPVAGGVMGAVGLVLLIACTNLANLLLARGAGRASEIAVRLTLGASRFRIVRLLLVENVLVASVGGAAALMLATAFARFARYTPLSVNGLPVEIAPIVDLTVVALTTAVSLLTGLGFGLVPAMRTSRPDVVRALAGDAILPHGRRRFGMRNFLVVPQMALSLLLLLIGSLFVRSYLAAQRIEGFDAEHSAMASVNLQLHGYAETRGRQLIQAVEREAQGLAGMAAIGLTDHVPLDSGTDRVAAGIDERALYGQAPFGYARVDAGYLAAIGIPIRAGRNFSERDTASAPDVIIVNQTAAAYFWPHQNPIGRTLLVSRWNDRPRSMEVVGVAADTSGDGRTGERQPFFYRPFDQDYSPRHTFVVRSANPAGAVDALRTLIRRVDPSVAIIEAKTVAAHVGEQTWQRRVAAVVLGLLGALGLVLASIGLYGVMAYLASQRTREVGLRIALGATRYQIVRMMMADGIRAVTIGGCLGIAAALLTARFLSKLLFGISPADPATFTLVPLLMALVAALACYLPVRRASRLDPLVALRHL